MAEQSGSTTAQRLKQFAGADVLANAQRTLATKKAGLAAATNSYNIVKGQNLANKSDINPYIENMNNFQREVEAQKKIIEDPTANLTGTMKDMVQGAEFAETVLGPEGLGRMRGSDRFEANRARVEEMSKKGLSAEELSASRAQSFQSMDASQQAAERNLAARLAASGVKGNAAGAQMMRMMASGVTNKAMVDQNLFLKSAEMQRTGLENLTKLDAAAQQFDLGQAAQEKAAIMAGATGLAQMGVAERTGQAQASASVQAAQASKPSGKK